MDFNYWRQQSSIQFLAGIHLLPIITYFLSGCFMTYNFILRKVPQCTAYRLLKYSKIEWNLKLYNNHVSSFTLLLSQLNPIYMGTSKISQHYLNYGYFGSYTRNTADKAYIFIQTKVGHTQSHECLLCVRKDSE